MGARRQSISQPRRNNRMTVSASPAAHTPANAAPATSSQDDADPLKQNAPVTGAGPHEPGLRVAVLHNSKLGAPASHGHSPKDVLAELDNPTNVQHCLDSLRALGHRVYVFDGSPELSDH